MNVETIDACRVCGYRGLWSIVDLGEMALTGRFPRPPEKVPVTPVELVRCARCGLLQLRHTADLREMYGQHYGYQSSLNRAMVRHLEGVAAGLRERVQLQNGDLVVDIGSNDGTFLACFPVVADDANHRPGIVKIGVDPTAGKFQYRPDITPIEDFFSAEAVREVYDRQARIITTIAMFYDLPDPVAIAREIASLLAPDGVWLLEQNYSPTMLERGLYDVIGQEHLEYYRLTDICRIVEAAGLEVVDASLNRTNGGSFAVLAAHPGSPYEGNAVQVRALLQYEDRHDGCAYYSGFSERVEQHAATLHALLSDIRRTGKTVCGYGASTRGAAVLQRANVGPDLVRCMGEVNADKFGCVTPGTGIPIVSDAEARLQRPDYWLVMPWHYRTGILRREREALEAGQAFIFPLPEIQVVTRDGVQEQPEEAVA